MLCLLWSRPEDASRFGECLKCDFWTETIVQDVAMSGIINMTCKPVYIYLCILVCVCLCMCIQLCVCVVCVLCVVCDDMCMG